MTVLEPRQVEFLNVTPQPYRIQRLGVRPIIRLEPIRAAWWPAA